ncbi:MAG: hypothetical protein ABI963_04435 [Rhizomicrobium sp.]
MSFVVLAASVGALQAADQPDPNIDPVLPDPKPNNAYFPPATATAGSADPGPSLHAMPVSGAMLAGGGPGCTILSPCAVDSPPLDHLTPVSSAPDAALAAWKKRQPAQH